MLVFETGLDFAGWDWQEFSIVAAALFLVIVLLAVLLKPKGKKAPKQVPASKPQTDMKLEQKAEVKEETKKEEPKAEPVKETPKAEPVKETPKADDSEELDEETAEEKEKSAKKKVAKYHISQNKDDDSEYASWWRVRKEGSQKTIKYFKTQKEAIAYAEKLAENQDSSIVIHKKDGSIRKQDYSKKV